MPARRGTISAQIVSSQMSPDNNSRLCRFEVAASASSRAIAAAYQHCARSASRPGSGRPRLLEVHERLRPPEQIALNVIDTEQSQRIELLVELDRTGNGLHAERARHLDDR